MRKLVLLVTAVVLVGSAISGISSAVAAEPYTQSNVYLSFGHNQGPGSPLSVSVMRWDETQHMVVPCEPRLCGTIRVLDNKVVPRMPSGQTVVTSESSYGYVDDTAYLSFVQYAGQPLVRNSRQLRGHVLTLDYVVIGAYNPQFGLPTSP